MEKDKSKAEKILNSGNEVELFKHFEALCLPITFKYQNIFKYDYLLSDDDVRSLCFKTFDLFMKNLKIKKIYDYDNYFKYLYIQTIKEELRKLNRIKYRLSRESINIHEKVNIEDSIYFSSTSNCFDNMNDEIVNYILESEESNLNQREKQILSLYVNGYNIREISKLLKLAYSVCFRNFESVLNKSKIFLMNKMPELFN